MMVAGIVVGLVVRFVPAADINWPVPIQPWGVIIALVPAALVAQHGLYLVLVKSEAVLAHFSHVPESLPAPTFDVGSSSTQRLAGQLVTARRSAARQSRSYFAPTQLFEQYAFLTTFLAIISLTLFYVCCDPPECLVKPAFSEQATQREADEANSLPGHAPMSVAVSADYISAMRLGASGAFIYVLIYLGRRNFQRDITPAAALWSGVQLVLGPTLALTLAYFLIAPTERAKEQVVDFAAVYFLAGMSPRLVADWISDKVEKLWLAGTANSLARSIALNQVRGITPTVESRLNEEGIDDAATLAMANPVRLMRNTPFDFRQILSWMDEALLMTTLPRHWSALEERGVTGAMDLAWYMLDSSEDSEEQTIPGEKGHADVTTPNSPAVVAEIRQKQDPDIAALAKEVNLEYGILRNVCWRLLNDDQLATIWAMYEADGEADDVQRAPLPPRTLVT
jgi:hypothetical protein